MAVKAAGTAWYRLSVITVAGVDLAGAPEYGARRYGVVGLAALRPNDGAAFVRALVSGRMDDATILGFVRRYDARVVAIDAPLSLPRGRCCANPACACARFGVVREAERELVRRGHRPYWTLLPSMIPLTLRGIALRRALEAEGRRVIEVFPGAVRDLVGAGRGDDRALLRALRRAGVRRVPARSLRRDAVDALAAAYVAVRYVRGECVGIGPEDEGQIWLPAPPSAGGGA